MSRTQLAGAVMAATAGVGAWQVPLLPGQSEVPPAVAVVQAIHAGCPHVAADRSKLVTATAISLAESNGRPEAEGDTTITDGTWGPSIGLFQVRSQWAQQGTGQARDADQLHDPVFNARAMCEISGGGANWRPWSVYLHGTYQDRLAEAEEAVGDSRSGSPATPGPPGGVQKGGEVSPPSVRERGLVNRLDEAYLDFGGIIDGGCSSLGSDQPRLAGGCSALAQWYWGDQQQATGGVPAAQPARSSGRFALPLPEEFMPADELDDPHHDYPAFDIGVPIGTPVYAPEGGEVVAVDNGACGVGVALAGDSGFRWGLCHFDSRTVDGGRVSAGQQVGVSGNTGRSTGPHLHVQLAGPDGGLVCPQASLAAWRGGDRGRAPSVADGADCSY